VSGAASFVTLLDWNGGDAASVVAYNERAWTPAPFGSSRENVLAVLHELRPSPGTRIDLALRETAAAFGQWTGRTGRSGNQRVAVLLSDGRQGGERDPVFAAADDLVAGGVLVYTVALGPDADRDMMVRVAGAAERALEAPSEADLGRLYEALAGQLVCR
jgi:hypothetical protein